MKFQLYESFEWSGSGSDEAVMLTMPACVAPTRAITWAMNVLPPAGTDTPVHDAVKVPAPSSEWVQVPFAPFSGGVMTSV